MNRLGLRTRIGLFFLLLFVLALGALLLGGIVALREGVPVPSLAGAGGVAALGIAAATALVWLKFDENVARPVSALSGALRARAHGGVSAPLDADVARHLADLAPAAVAVCDRLAELDREVEALLAEATAELEAEKRQLSAILSEIPVAIMAVDRSHRVTLYDRQSVHALARVQALGVGRSVFDYLQREALTTAVERLSASDRQFVDVDLPLADGSAAVRARLRLIGPDRGYVLAMEVEEDVTAERPLVFDFGLIEGAHGSLDDVPLSRLPFVVFDTETTGLDPDRDEIVQIGAVRAINGRLVAGERFETLVHPGRPIPALASRVHGITDATVADAPLPETAVLAFHRFARGEVLVAHNAPFDLRFLKRHEEALGVMFDNPVLDTVLLSAALYGETVEHTLDAIATRLDVQIDAAERHTATGDALATAHVLMRMLPMLRAAGVVTLGDAVAAMRRHQRLMPAAAGFFPDRRTD